MSTELFSAFGPDSRLGGWVLDLFLDWITSHCPPCMGLDEYLSYMKDPDCLVVSSDVSVPKLATAWFSGVGAKSSVLS
jgi:hypothetical protein